MEVAQWGPGAEPQWSSGAKPPEAGDILNEAKERHNSRTVLSIGSCLEKISSYDGGRAQMPILGYATGECGLLAA